LRLLALRLCPQSLLAAVKIKQALLLAVAVAV
jgi:hypothetical protein